MLTDKLKHAADLIKLVIEDLQKTPENNCMLPLLEALQNLDEEYEEFCKDTDLEYGYEHGTTYKEGINLEWYIESTTWHNISLMLRQLRIAKEKLNERAS